MTDFARGPDGPQRPPQATEATETARADRLARALGPWFVQHQRDLEWRRTRDPYAIWVSEVMLQQTRVDTVKAYWTPFMQRFPDIATLAAADEQQVLAAWSGLGYYRRARLLHQGARHVHTTMAGTLPTRPDELRQIPGIGRYTAGAIASIAHDAPHALVDGNVARVLSRLQAITEPKLQLPDAAGHWTMAQRILEAGSPRVLAQALMELGATVCTPQLPRCGECPVRGDCLAFARDLVATIPAPKKKAPSPQQDLWALALQRQGKLLLVRRPAEGLLAGMWTLPLLDRPAAAPEAPHGSLFDRARPTPAAIRKLTGLRVSKPEALRVPVKHVFTHRVWILWPVRAAVDLSDGSGSPPDEHAWIAPGERPVGGIPTITEKLLEPLGY
ncbi:MAG TPA: A/G-specific adenine glycosylase [Nannocystis sp.]